MTTIKATCPTCGEVALTPDDIELRLDRSGVEESSYAFTCPTCMCVVRKPADDRIVRLLISGGVTVVEIDDLVEVSGRRFEFPDLTLDDLLDFHEYLDTEDWFDDLVAQVRRENVR